MQTLNTTDIITGLMETIEELIPVYMQNPEDEEKSKGNIAFCIIDEDGNVFGKFMGPDKIRARELYRIAWTKASQVSITGVSTGEFEKQYFSDPENVDTFGIKAPDMIGWFGGQPLYLKNGGKLFVGFSGFRGATDLEIMQRALAVVETKFQ
jgi:glc operon protein GlcG